MQAALLAVLLSLHLKLTHFVCTLARCPDPHSIGFDLLNEASIAQQADVCRAFGPYQIIVDATGALTIDGVGPEKALPSRLHADTPMVVAADDCKGDTVSCSVFGDARRSLGHVIPKHAGRRP